MNIDPNQSPQQAPGKKANDYDKGKIVSPESKEDDGSLISASPTDSRADEKVIVNEQRENKIVNAPSQSAPQTGEGNAADD